MKILHSCAQKSYFSVVLVASKTVARNKCILLFQVVFITHLTFKSSSYFLHPFLTSLQPKKRGGGVSRRGAWTQGEGVSHLLIVGGVSRGPSSPLFFYI